jgi:hypothetical protein
MNIYSGSLFATGSPMFILNALQNRENDLGSDDDEKPVKLGVQLIHSQFTIRG